MEREPCIQCGEPTIYNKCINPDCNCSVSIEGWVEDLTKKVKRRNTQIADLKARLKELKEKNTKIYNLLDNALEWANEVVSVPSDSPTITYINEEFEKLI